MIDAIFFDFGGVIASSPFEAFAAYEQRAGLPRHFIRSVNSRNPDDNAWAHLERGSIDVPAFVAEFESEAAAMGHPVNGYEVLGCLEGEIRPAMVDAVRRCRESFTTALLTNNVVSMDAIGPGADRIAPVLEHFDVILESSVVGVRKPDRRFYQLACERVGVDATGVVFLDDLGINLKPAREMGMHTIKVADPDAAITELEHVTGLELR